MITEEMKNLLRDALSIEDSFKRGWAYSKAIVRLGSVEELEAARAFVQSLPGKLPTRAVDEDDIEHEIGFRNQWVPHVESVDSALGNYPRVANRVQGLGYKVAILRFADFCSCDVKFACELLEEIIVELEKGCIKVERHCGPYADGQWPWNHRPSVLAAMAMFSQRPCWVMRHLFLPEVMSSGMRGFTTVSFATYVSDSHGS